MPITRQLNYNPPKETGTPEKYVLELLNDIRRELVKTEKTWGEFGLHKILQFVEKGKLIVPFIGGNYDYEVDLSPAQEFIENYRFNSEGGCQSCKNIGRYKPHSDSTRVYCKLYEEENEKENSKLDIILEGNSPRILEYFESGCKDRIAKFRPIGDLLKEAN